MKPKRARSDLAEAVVWGIVLATPFLVSCKATDPAKAVEVLVADPSQIGSFAGSRKYLVGGAGYLLGSLVRRDVDPEDNERVNLVLQGRGRLQPDETRSLPAREFLKDQGVGFELKALLPEALAVALRGEGGTKVRLIASGVTRETLAEDSLVRAGGLGDMEITPPRTPSDLYFVVAVHKAKLLDVEVLDKDGAALSVDMLQKALKVAGAMAQAQADAYQLSGSRLTYSSRDDPIVYAVDLAAVDQVLRDAKLETREWSTYKSLPPDLQRVPGRKGYYSHKDLQDVRFAKINETDFMSVRPLSEATFEEAKGLASGHGLSLPRKEDYVSAFGCRLIEPETSDEWTTEPRPEDAKQGVGPDNFFTLSRGYWGNASGFGSTVRTSKRPFRLVLRQAAWEGLVAQRFVAELAFVNGGPAVDEKGNAIMRTFHELGVGRLATGSYRVLLAGNWSQIEEKKGDLEFFCNGSLLATSSTSGTSSTNGTFTGQLELDLIEGRNSQVEILAKCSPKPPNGSGFSLKEVTVTVLRLPSRN